tara:strand:- start:445 stop:1164 length:720 start_codon:yes stop_codon:yes gene_type:complete
MEAKLPPELRFNFVDDEIKDPETGEVDPNFIYEEQHQLHEPDVTLDIPSVEKDPIDDSLIFDKILVETPDVGGLDTEAIEVETTKNSQKQKPVKLNKNGQPRKKRQYSEEQKQAMRERLAKARQQVGKNKQQKQDEKVKEQKYKQLKKQTRDIKIKEMEEKVNNKDIPTLVKAVKPTLTKEDIKEAQLDAIVAYETIRKKRKAKKKEEQMVEQHKQELQNLVKKELGWQNVAGRFSNCY